jgi:co-chaperonin GroES (HSP10)
MKTVDVKILVKHEELKDSRLSEKLGGFELPAGAGEYDTYRVISVGENVTSSLKEGDLIATYPKAGHEITVEGVSYRVITLSDILLVF